MNVMEYLDINKSAYEIKRHRPAFTAQQLAQEEHVHGINVAKPVIVKGDGQYYMCVVPASFKVNMQTLKSLLEVNEIELADERELKELFPGSQIGAEPPFGSLYGLPTMMDERLRKDDFILFQDGSHDEAIKLKMSEYLKVEAPKIYSFSERLQ